MTELTITDFQRLERHLHERREALREILHAALLATRKQPYTDLAGEVHDTGDESVADLLRDVELAGHERQLQESRDVEAALERMVNDDFGRCIDCRADIDRDRLLVYPTAKRCLRCQQRHESRRAGGTDRSPSL